MVTKWMDAAMKRMMAPWATTERAATERTGPEPPPAEHLGGSRTPDGVTSWLAFHDIEIKGGAGPTSTRRQP